MRWTFLRAAFHRGYVLVSGLYFVVVAHLSAAQLVLLGTVIGITLVLSDGPTGVWSDAFSRKWPLVIGHLFLVAGMVMTGAVTAFPLILVTQVLWGIGWGFSSGADVAWITDELDQPERIARVLTARARWELVGGAVGMVAFGLLAWATSLATAILASGLAMLLPAILVTTRFTETNFTPAHDDRLNASLSIFRRGADLSRRDTQILLVFAATLIINGAATVAWLFPKQLIDLGFPSDPILWYTGLGILGSLFGAVVLRVIEGRIEGTGVAPRTYVLACLTGLVGLVVLAYAPEALIGCAGVLLVRGVAINVTRPMSVIWVNRRTSSDVRATVQSFLGQAESIGEIIGGLALALLAQHSSIPTTLTAAGVLIACAGLIVTRARAERVPLSPQPGRAG